MKRYIDVITGRKCALSALASLIFAFAAQADWTLSGTSGDVTMTDGTATLYVKVLDANARTLRLGRDSLTSTSKGNSKATNGKTDAWNIDLSKPITLAGGTDTYTIVEVGGFAFFNNTSVTCPASGLDLTSVTNIGNVAFQYCKGFSKILLSSKLEEVGHSAFNQCWGNVSFDPQLPPSLKTIHSGAFGHHTQWDEGNVMKLSGSLELLGLETIEGGAFNWLPGITSVVVGPKLTSIVTTATNIDNNDSNGWSPFSGLTMLETITFRGPAPASLPAKFLTDRYKANKGGTQTASTKTTTVTCYLYEDYTNGWVTAMAATGGTIADYTDQDNEKVFAKWTGGNDNRTILLALLDGHPASETEPQFTTAPTLVKSGSLFLFTGYLSEGEGALSAVFTATDGTEYAFPLTSGNEVTGDANETAYTLAFDLSSGAAGLPQNQTYSFAIRGTNSHSETVTLAGKGTFFFGEVDVSVSAASVSENGGSLTYTVSRTGTDGALTIPLVYSGTASEFANFREVPHSLTIADGASSATITVETVIALDTADTTLTVAPSAAELFFAGDSATATIADWDEPAIADFPSTVEFTAAGCSLAQADALENFPVLVRISAEQVSQIGSSGGLAFFQDNTLLPHEVDTWSTTDGALVWVGMDSLYKDAVVTLAYGDANYTAPGLAYSLWREAGYVAVWHLGEVGDGVITVANSTVVGTTLDGTANAVTSAKSDGQIGAGRTISSSTSANGWIDTPSPDDYLTSPTTFTASLWAYHLPAGAGRDEYVLGTKTGDSEDIVFGCGLRLMKTETDDDKFKCSALNLGNHRHAENTFTGKTTNEWMHIAYSFDVAGSPTYRVGRNGETQDVVDHVYGETGDPLTFGNVYAHVNNKGFTGSMDEIRIRNVMSTADWLAAEYATVSNPEFLTCPQSSAVRGTMFLVW